MADLSTIEAVDAETGVRDVYNIKDAVARAGIGDLTKRNTTNQSDLVSAINEVVESAGGGDCGITYIESNDTENLVVLRELTSGTYVLQGKFRPYSGSTRTLSFSSKLLVNIITKTAATHVQVFYPVNNVVQFLNITDDAYERTDVNFNDLQASMETLENTVKFSEAQDLTDEQKAQARENIGAVDADFVNDCIESSRYETVLTDLSPTETLEAYILLQATGVLTQLQSGDKSYVVKKYDVAGISTVAITASAAYSAYLYSFCNTSGGIIELSEPATAGSTVTEIVEQVVQVPENATALYVSYIVTASNVAAVQAVELKPIGDTKKWEGKKWVCIGDSLTEVNIRTTMHYHDYVAEATGISVVNLGISGTGYAKGSNTFNSRVDSVPTDADVVTIFGSGNDLSAGIELGEVADTGTETLCGCINTTIDNLIAIMPAVQLGIVTPTPWVGQQPGAGKPMEAYANAIVEICKARSIPCLDLYHCSNLRPWTEEGRAACYSKDDGNGVHPDETGHKLIAPRFKAFLESLLM